MKKYKEKLMLISLISILGVQTYGVVDPINGLYVSGSNIVERVEESYNIGGSTNEKDKGGIPNYQVAVIRNGGTLENYSVLKSEQDTYRSDLIVIIGGGVTNKLQKTDNLITMSGNAKLVNNMKIEMGSTYHKIHTYRVLGLGGYYVYSNYTKNVISAENSVIDNNGEIIRNGDRFKVSDDLGVVELLIRTEANYEKNNLNVINTTVNNNGDIISGRDYNPEELAYLDVSLLDLGLKYTRHVSGIKASGGVINNSSTGKIFIEGDIYKASHLGGVEVSALGADLLGRHYKYGVNLSNGGVLNNEGIIEVERDYEYGDFNGEIIHISLIGSGGSVVGVGLLNFGNMQEYSIGVNLNNSTFNNYGGTVTVGSNVDKGSFGLAHSAAIAVQGTNKSTINFDGGYINLDGMNVFVSALSNESKMFFRGDTNITYEMTENGVAHKDVKTNIFNNDSSSNHYIYGNLNIMNGNLTIAKDNNVSIGIAEKEVLDAEGNHTGKYEDTDKFGKLTVSGNLILDGNINVEGTKLVGQNLDDYKGQTIIEANKIQSNGGQVKSESYIFDISTGTVVIPDNGTLNEGIVITDITRKNFKDIVDNNELGDIFESSYDGANEEQLEVYRLLAQGEDAESFNKVVNEVTGKDTITTLNSQIYDITKDLNKQFKDFAKSNIQDGVVFKYINSESELGANSSTVGFERESSGVMVGYNKYLSEKLRLGAGFSYIKSDIDYTSASSNDVTTWNFRGYSDYNLEYANLFSDISFGYNEAKNRRVTTEVDQLEIKEGDLDVYSLSFNNSLYKNYQLNDKLDVTTSLNLDFTYLYQEDFKESVKMGASAENIDAFYITAGMGIDGKYNLFSFGNSKINMVTGMEYAYDIVSDTEDMSLKVSAFDPSYKESSRELDKKSLTYDIGLNYEYMDRYSVGVRYTKELINDVDNDQIGVDFTYKF